MDKLPSQATHRGVTKIDTQLGSNFIKLPYCKLYTNKHRKWALKKGEPWLTEFDRRKEISVINSGYTISRKMIKRAGDWQSVLK